MSIEGMQTLVWSTMSRDDVYRTRMLGADRTEFLKEFDLTEEEYQAILEIKASNLGEFYNALSGLIAQSLKSQ